MSHAVFADPVRATGSRYLVQRFRRELFVREEEDVELVLEEGGGGGVAGGGDVGQVVRVEGVGEEGDPAVVW